MDTIASPGEPDLLYDVFISYSSKDKDWVRGELLKRLGQRGYRTCLDVEAFQPNTPFLLNMLGSVRRSKRLLMILSPDYFNSEYTKFEWVLRQLGRSPDAPVPVIWRKLEPGQEIPFAGAKTCPNFDAGLDEEKEFRKLLEALEAQAQVPARDQSVAASLILWAEFMELETVSKAIARFREDFDEALGQIRIMAAYKDLHDQLHTLQFKCYYPIQADISRFPDDILAVENLAHYELTMAEVVDKVKEVESRGFLPRTRLRWVGELVSAHQQLCEALESESQETLRDSGDRIERLLRLQPTWLNKDLLATVESLRLDRLGDAMGTILGEMKRVGFKEETSGLFASVVNDLAELRPKLRSKIDEHDLWQVFDFDGRQVEFLAESDADELEQAWPSLRDLLANLTDGRPDAWADVLRKAAARMDQAADELRRLKGVAPSEEAPRELHRARERLLACFRNLRPRASGRFFEVDKELKELCDQLNRVGDRLKLILELFKS
jgi:hypothetical protein